MAIEKLYEVKGKITTQLEILQAQLQQVNAEIIKELNAPRIPEATKPEAPKAE